MFWRQKKGGEKMRKRISVLFAALMLALTMSFGGVAFVRRHKRPAWRWQPGRQRLGQVPGWAEQGHVPGRPEEVSVASKVRSRTEARF